MSEEENGDQEPGVVSLGNSKKAGKRNLGKKLYLESETDIHSNEGGLGLCKNPSLPKETHLQ